LVIKGLLLLSDKPLEANMKPKRFMEAYVLIISFCILTTFKLTIRWAILV